MRKIRMLGWCALFVAMAAMVARASDTITFNSLLGEMVDRAAAARFPRPAYTCRQASSYDRASVSPDDPASWQANNDRSFFIRSEENDGREESVMLDAEGPGCIVRFWATSGNPIGNIRVYLDGAERPVINAPAKTLIGGNALVGPPLSEVCARGMNFYLPIPYAKHCKITYDRPNFHKSRNADDLLYYQINYRTYVPGTQVESFSQQGFAAAQQRIARLQQQLLKPADTVPAGSETLSSATFELPAGATREMKIDGPKAIRKISVRIEADDLEQASRTTVVSAKFDGEATIWCPIGDFFGSGVGVNPYQGWWRTVAEDGTMTCYWVMPFKKSAEMTIANLGEKPVAITPEFEVTPWEWDDRSMHFHTTWRQEYPIDTSTHHDWNYVTIDGQGVYMGDSLVLNNPNPVWWGEGDEKIYFDGQKFPSHFGTGTEDYYGYAWCTPEFFESPFHAQPRAQGPRNQGHVTNTRVRLLDGIPFKKNFRFDMEVWHWRPCTIAYAATTHWYGRPGAKANYGPMPEWAKVIVAEGPKPVVVEGAIEGEGLKILEKTGSGTTEVQTAPEHRWSRDQQIWWRNGKPGDTLVFELTVDKAGKYKLSAALTKAIDYGIVQLALDGKKLGPPIDLLNNGVVTQVYYLGTHDLTAGQHRLSARITGANPKAVKSYMFGIDYLKLDPAE